MLVMVEIGIPCFRKGKVDGFMCFRSTKDRCAALCGDCHWRLGYIHRYMFV
jgi:hypothetical protein